MNCANFATEIKPIKKDKYGMKMKTKMVMVLAVCGLLSACSDSTKTPPLKSVMVEKVSTANGESTKCLSGVVQENREISVGFKTPGQLTHIYVKEGQYVRRGQLVAVLDDKDYKLGVESAKIQYCQMRDEVNRMRKLYAAKSLSENDFEKAVSGLNQLGVQLQSNRNKLSYTRLYAPSDGYVQSVNFEQSEMVDAGTPVITLIDNGRMEVIADIPASDYVNRAHISRFACRSPFVAGEEIPMRLMSIVPKADGNQLYEMRLAFAVQPDRRISAGMNIEVRMNLRTKADDGKISVPQHAIFEREGKSYVWVVSGGNTVVSREVTCSAIDGDGHALVMQGLAGDEMIVTAGVHHLLEHEKVKVLAKPGKTNVGGLI